MKNKVISGLVIIGIACLMVTACGSKETLGTAATEVTKTTDAQEQNAVAESVMETVEENDIKVDAETEAIKENTSDFVEMEDESAIENEKEIGKEVESMEFQPSLEELSEEEVIAIAEDGFRAIKEMSPEEMIKYTNIELLYYMGHAEKADDEKMIDEITDLVSEMEEGYNSLGIVGHYAAIENIELYDAKPISIEEIDELNAMLLNSDFAMLGGIQDYQYNIENAYKLQMSYDGMEENQESYMLVVCANGQWELDVCLAVMRDTYRMIMS